jgi:hypothetical protein
MRNQLRQHAHPAKTAHQRHQGEHRKLTERRNERFGIRFVTIQQGSMEDQFINRVAQSGIMTFNLENYYTQGERKVLDIRDSLFMGMILKEKDLRDWVKQHDWEQYRGTCVAITCSADAIIPTWAYMLIAARLNGVATFYIFGDTAALETALYVKALAEADIEEYRDKRVVIKGCGDLPVPASAYVEISRILLPVVKSLMYGEPCSTVPVYKKA